jgi:DNA-binding CsgD family transcriptional regulator
LAYFRPDLGASTSLDRQCDWLIHFDRSSDPDSWAIGVAGTALAASITRRADLLAMCADARAALDPADHFHHRILAFPLAFLAQIQGDDSEMATIAAEAVAAGDDLTVLAAAGSMALVATRSGYFSDARRFLEQVDSVLRRHETELAPGVSGFASQAALELAVLTGDFVAAHELAETMRASRSNWAVPIACQVAYLATMTGDAVRVRQAASDVGREVPRTFAPVVHYLDAMVAQLDQRWSDAANSGLRGWAGNSRNGALQGLFSPLVTTALLACGRIDEARTHVSNWGGVVERLGRRPLQSATFHLSGALVHLATGRDGLAVDEAHALLDVADTHGFALMRVDALELIAEVASLRGNDVLAARLLGATSTERRRIGYTARIRAEPDLAIEREHRVTTGEPVAFAEGAALSIDQAVELAQRARGERHRPSHGWDSLTPTEHKVIELVAEGLGNSQIGAQLLMGTATVKSHLTHVFVKLGLTNRTELAAEAHRHVE